MLVDPLQNKLNLSLQTLVFGQPLFAVLFYIFYLIFVGLIFLFIYKKNKISLKTIRQLFIQLRKNEISFKDIPFFIKYYTLGKKLLSRFLFLHVSAHDFINTSAIFNFFPTIKIKLLALSILKQPLYELFLHLILFRFCYLIFSVCLEIFYIILFGIIPISLLFLGVYLNFISWDQAHQILSVMTNLIKWLLPSFYIKIKNIFSAGK